MKHARLPFPRTLMVIAFLAVVVGSFHTALVGVPNKDDTTAKLLDRAGGKYRRTSRLSCVATLADSDVYPHGDIWYLSLRDIEISRELALATQSLSSLTDCLVTNCDFSQTDTAFLPESSRMRLLAIESSTFQDCHLVGLGRCSNLVFLFLKNTRISDRSVEEIVKCSNLTCIVLKRNMISLEGLAKIKAAFPKAKVVTE